MARPRTLANDVFTSREIAVAADLTPRNFGLLGDEGLAPPPFDNGADGQSGSRLYLGDAMAQTALIGALQLAGFELLVAARLAAAFTDSYVASRGRLPSNLMTFVRSRTLNPAGGTPWGETPRDVPIERDFWIHHLLRNRSGVYRRAVPIIGDCIIEIADRTYVLTSFHALGVATHSSATGDGLPAAPEYRIVGRGNSATVVPIYSEVPTMDFEMDPKSRDKMRRLELEYLSGREAAVALVRINLSLAIRNAFDRLQDVRDGQRAA